MVDILASIWMNIESFSYPKLYNVDPRDLELLNKAKNNLIFYPTLSFIICFGISRNRERIFKLIKRSFLNREKTFKLDMEHYKMKNKSKEEVTTVISNNDEMIETIQYNEYKAISEIPVFESRKVINKKEPYKPQIIRDTKNIDSFSEEYGGWLKMYKKNMKHGIFPLKEIFKKRLDNKEELSVRINRFLYTTKLIYFPFLIILIVCFKEFIITYFGLYCKYQPLIDRYYEHLSLDSKLKNKL